MKVSTLRVKNKGSFLLLRSVHIRKVQRIMGVLHYSFTRIKWLQWSDSPSVKLIYLMMISTTKNIYNYLSGFKISQKGLSKSFTPASFFRDFYDSFVPLNRNLSIVLIVFCRNLSLSLEIQLSLSACDTVWYNLINTSDNISGLYISEYS